MTPRQQDHQSRKRSTQSTILSANSFWNVANFRGQLIEGLVGAGHRVRIVAPGADAAWAREHGAEAIDIAIDRSGLNPVTDARLLLDYVRLFRRVRPGLFLGFTAKPNIYGSLVAASCRVPSLPNVSGLGTAFISDGPLSRFVSLLYRIAFRKCPVVFFQNPDDLDLFAERKIVTRAQARLLPGSGIDLEFFAPAPATVDDHPCFLFIGRLLGDKGVREFVEAAHLLRTERPGWRFQLLGELDPGNRTSIRADELRRWLEQGLVEHLGHSDDVRPHIAAATAVVLPSYREGLPRVLLESAAMARPLIATDVPGNRRLVEHRVNGLLCQARNGPSLAAAMRELGSMDQDKREQLGRAARALVERDYGVERVVEAYLEAVAQLAGGAGV